MIRIFLSAFLSAVFFPQAYATDQPAVLKCVAVDASGNVTLTWINPPDTCGSFTAHYIYGSQNAGGPYTLLDSIKVLAQTTFLHAGANAATNGWHYYILTVGNCSGQPLYSDTLHSIKLDVTNPGNGFASLAWNHLHAPPLSSSGWYLVYREYPAGTWTLIDSTQGISYQDEITLCNAALNYRIGMRDSSGCVSVSSVDGGTFSDITVPAIPPMDSVTVDSLTGRASLGWEPSASPDTRGYIIYQLINGVWTPIDTVYGINTVFYTNNSSSAGNVIEQYRVAAFDSCSNISPLSIFHNTILLKASLDKCKGEVSLTWNSYINWKGGVTGYHVLVSRNGGPYTQAAVTSSLAYTYTGLVAGDIYCFIVMARDTGSFTASSNRVCLAANIPVKPAFLYLKKATVVSASQVRIEFFTDTAADAREYHIVRSTGAAGPYVHIGQLPFSMNPVRSFTDNSANTASVSYYYKIEAYDSCNTLAFTSNRGRTVNLTVNAGADLVNNLSWNGYETWSGGVDHYNIYRSIDGVWSAGPIATLNATVYQDDVSSYISSEGTFCYYIEAVEGSGNVYGFTDTSRSDIECVVQHFKLFVPNAFSPVSPVAANRVFKPVNAFVDHDQYQLVVFNKWGHVIFLTKDPNEGWDGTFLGNLVQEGVYPYWIRLTGTNGKSFEKRGTVTLIR